MSLEADPHYLAACHPTETFFARQRYSLRQQCKFAPLTGLVPGTTISTNGFTARIVIGSRVFSPERFGMPEGIV